MPLLYKGDNRYLKCPACVVIVGGNHDQIRGVSNCNCSRWGARMFARLTGYPTLPMVSILQYVFSHWLSAEVHYGFCCLRWNWQKFQSQTGVSAFVNNYLLPTYIVLMLCMYCSTTLKCWHYHTRTYKGEVIILI